MTNDMFSDDIFDTEQNPDIEKRLDGFFNFLKKRKIQVENTPDKPGLSSVAKQQEFAYKSGYLEGLDHLARAYANLKNYIANPGVMQQANRLDKLKDWIVRRGQQVAKKEFNSKGIARQKELAYKEGYLTCLKHALTVVTNLRKY